MRRAGLSPPPTPSQIQLFICTGLVASLHLVAGIPTPRQQKADVPPSASELLDSRRHDNESLVEAPAAASSVLDTRQDQDASTKAAATHAAAGSPPPQPPTPERQPLQLLQQKDKLSDKAHDQRQNASAETQEQRQFASALQVLEALENMGVADMNYHQMKLMQDLETEVLRSGKRRDVTGRVYSWREFRRAHPFTHSFDVEVMWQELEPVDETAKSARAALVRRE